MKKLVSPAIIFGALALYFSVLPPAFGEEPAARGSRDVLDRIVGLRKGLAQYDSRDIEFMVQVVFADAMNPDGWANNWIRKEYIPSVTHLQVAPAVGREGGEMFTVVTLPESANYRVVVVKGFLGNPNVRRWMSLNALRTYFLELTTTEGNVRLFEPGFMGLNGMRMGLNLKEMLEDLHARGLMKTKNTPPLSKREEKENTVFRLSLIPKAS